MVKSSPGKNAPSPAVTPNYGVSSAGLDSTASDELSGEPLDELPDELFDELLDELPDAPLDEPSGASAGTVGVNIKSGLSELSPVAPRRYAGGQRRLPLLDDDDVPLLDDPLDDTPDEFVVPELVEPVFDDGARRMLDPEDGFAGTLLPDDSSSWERVDAVLFDGARRDALPLEDVSVDDELPLEPEDDSRGDATLVDGALLLPRLSPPVALPPDELPPELEDDSRGDATLVDGALLLPLLSPPVALPPDELPPELEDDSLGAATLVAGSSLGEADELDVSRSSSPGAASWDVDSECWLLSAAERPSVS